MHMARREFDEYVCHLCGKRWHHKEEPPQCDAFFFSSSPVKERVIADEKLLIGAIKGYWLCIDQWGIETIVYSDVDKMKFINRYQGALCTWYGEKRQ